MSAFDVGRGEEHGDERPPCRSAARSAGRRDAVADEADRDQRARARPNWRDRPADQRRRACRGRSPNGSTRLPRNCSAEGDVPEAVPGVGPAVDERRAERAGPERQLQVDEDERSRRRRRRRSATNERGRRRIARVDRQHEQADRRRPAGASASGCRPTARRRRPRPTSQRSAPAGASRPDARASQRDEEPQSRIATKARWSACASAWVPIVQAIGVSGEAERRPRRRGAPTRSAPDRSTVTPGRDRHAEADEEVHPEGRLAERLQEDRASQPRMTYVGKPVGWAVPRSGADGLELAGVPERHAGQHRGPCGHQRQPRDHDRGAGGREPPASGSRGPGSGASGAGPVLRSDPPSTLVQEPFPGDWPRNGGTERGTGAPSRATGTREPSARSSSVLALGLALRLIIAYLLPGSGFGVGPRRVPVLGAQPRDRGPVRLLPARLLPRLHAGLPVCPVARRLVTSGMAPDVGATSRSCDLIKVAADPGRPRDRLAGLVDGPGARRPAPRWPCSAALVAVLNPITLVRQRGLGPGRFGRRRLPAARRCASCGATGPSGPRSSRSSRRSSSRSSGSSSRSSRSSRSAARCGRPAAGGDAGTGPGRPIADPDRPAARRASVTAVVLCLPVRPVGRRVHRRRRRSSGPGLLEQVVVDRRRLPVPDGQRLQPLGARPVATSGNSLASDGPWVCDFAASRRDRRSGAYCGRAARSIAAVPAVVVGTALLLAAIALVLWLVARRPDRLTILRRAWRVLALAFFVVPDPRPRALRLPVLRARRDPRRGLAGAGGSPTSSCRVATFANMYVVLTTLYPDNPSITTGSGSAGDPLRAGRRGRRARSTRLAFVWVLLQLRRRRAIGRRLRVERGRPVDAVPADGGARALARAARSGAGAPGRAGRQRAGLGLPRRRAGDAARAGGPPAAPARRRRRRAASAADLAPLGRPSPSSGSSAGSGRGSATAPIRPDRTRDARSARAAAGSTGSTCGCWSCSSSPPAACAPSGWPSRTRCTSTRSTTPGRRPSSSRTGATAIDHDIYEWTHPHLAKYAMAGRARRCGARTRSARRASSASRSAPRSSSRGAHRPGCARRPGRRAAPRRDRRARSGPTTSRPARCVSVVPAAGVGALAFDPTGHQLDPRLRRRPPRDARRARRSGWPASTSGRSPSSSPTRGPPDRAAAAGRRRDDDRRPPRPTGSAWSTSTTASVLGSLDLPGIADLAPGGSGAALVATVADGDRSGGRWPPSWPSCSAATRPTTRRSSPIRTPAPTVVARRSRARGDVRTAVDAAIADGSLPGVAIEDVPAHRGRDRRRRRLRRRRPRHRWSRRSRWTAARTAWRSSPGSTTPSCTRPAATRPSPDYEVIAIGGDARQGRPGRPGQPPAARPRDAGRLRRVQPAGPRPRAGPRARPVGRRRLDRLRHRAARERGLRRRPAARGFEPVAWAADVEPTYPADDPQQLLVVRRRRRDGRDRARVARLRLAPARRHRRGADRRPALPARPDPVPAPPRGRAGRAVRPGRRHVLRPVADRDERRLRRPVHRRRLHAVRGALDRLVAWPAGVLAGHAGRSGCCSGSPWRANGSPPTRSAPWCC